MDITKRIIVQAIKTKDNILIPIWDKRLVFEKAKDYGNQISIEADRGKYYSVIECIYNLKTKQLEVGIDLDIYPKDLEFKINESILFEKENRKILELTVTDVLYEEYHLDILKGKKVVECWPKAFQNIDNNALYAIKQWKPFYLLSDGTKVEYNYKMFHKY